MTDVLTAWIASRLPSDGELARTVLQRTTIASLDERGMGRPVSC